MNTEKTMFVIRIVMGWLCFYAGITKVINPAWSSVGYLKSAQTFSGFYTWLANSDWIGVVNWLNAWGLTLLGVSLLLGALVRLSSILGALLMLLYYFPVLSFPYVGSHSFIIDEHIIYILVLALLFSYNAGKKWGIDNYLTKISWLKKIV